MQKQIENNIIYKTILRSGLTMSQSSNAELATKIRSSYTKEVKEEEFSLKEDSLISTFKTPYCF